jgi:hypothetical protein
MSTSPGGAYADVIAQEKVKELCPEEFEAFLVALRESEVVSDEMSPEDGDLDRIQYVTQQYLMFDDHCPPEIDAAWQALVTRFAEVTRDEAAFGGSTPGLKLFIGYHDSESSGGAYDGVDGVYWVVDGMYELSSAGRKCQEFVERKHFVQWG